MRNVRRCSQIIFFLFFGYLFFQAVYPFEPRIAPDLFLRSSPLVAITSMLAERSWIVKLYPALILLCLTIPLGRFFCGWICPLGTLIDATDRALKKSRPRLKIRSSLRFRSWKFYLLSVIFIAALLSVQLTGYFDPLVILTRTCTTAIFPMVAFFTETILGALLRINWLEGIVYEIYDWLHQVALPVEPHYFQNGIFYLLLLAGILLAGLVTPRFWCRNLCPLGALLGLFSKFRLTRRVVNASCTKCGKCQRECKMNAIEDDYTQNSTVECIECMHCVAVCPPSSIQYQIRWPRQPQPVDFTKRRFLGSALTSLVVVGSLKSSYLSRNQKNDAIRPPGVLPESQFLDRCVRCHECTRICMTTGGCLQPALLESGWEGIWTPISVPRTGFCEYNCNLCGQVCPTGAIVRLTLAEKQKMKMGTASFDKNRCIPWYRLENCLVCEEHCPVAEKAIKFEEKAVIRPDGSHAVVKFPYIVESRCVGCGICVTKCPLAGQAGIFVSNAGEIRAAS